MGTASASARMQATDQSPPVPGPAARLHGPRGGRCDRRVESELGRNADARAGARHTAIFGGTGARGVERMRDRPEPSRTRILRAQCRRAIAGGAVPALLGVWNRRAGAALRAQL